MIPINVIPTRTVLVLTVFSSLFPSSTHLLNSSQRQQSRPGLSCSTELLLNQMNPARPSVLSDQNICADQIFVRRIRHRVAKLRQ